MHWGPASALVSLENISVNRSIDSSIDRIIIRGTLSRLVCPNSRPLLPRFVVLLDELYEHRCRLIASSSQPLSSLFEMPDYADPPPSEQPTMADQGRAVQSGDTPLLSHGHDSTSSPQNDVP